MKTKICKKCGIELPLTEEFFRKVKGCKDGFGGQCKKCQLEYGKQYKKQWRKDNKDKILEYKKQYYRSHKDNVLEKNKQWRKTNKDKLKKYQYINKKSIEEHRKQYYELNKNKILEKQKRYRKENKEKYKYKHDAEYGKEYRKKYYELNKNNDNFIEHRKKYYEANKDKYAENSKRYYEANKDSINERKKQYFKSNRAIINAIVQRRRTKKQQLPSTLTNEQWEQIKLHFNNTCCYCGKELPLAQEHFIALSNGGEFTHNNIVCACKSCNSSKNDKDFFEWYPKYRYYSKKREQMILKFLGYKDDKQQLTLLL